MRNNRPSLRNSFLSMLLLGLVFPAQAQQKHKTFLRFEFASVSDISKLSDQNSYLKAVPLVNISGGVFLRQELNDPWFLEGGIQFKHYMEGFGFKNAFSYSSSPGGSFLLFPLRVAYNFKFFEKRLRVAPLLGYTLGIGPAFNYGRGFGRHFAGPNQIIEYNYLERRGADRIFSLIQTGLRLECEVAKNIRFTVGGDIYSGLNDVKMLDINYSLNNDEFYTGSLESKGSFWQLSAGVEYPISRLWNKDE